MKNLVRLAVAVLALGGCVISPETRRAESARRIEELNRQLVLMRGQYQADYIGRFGRATDCRPHKSGRGEVCEFYRELGESTVAGPNAYKSLTHDDISRRQRTAAYELIRVQFDESGRSVLGEAFARY